MFGVSALRKDKKCSQNGNNIYRSTSTPPASPSSKQSGSSTVASSPQTLSKPALFQPFLPSASTTTAVSRQQQFLQAVSGNPIQQLQRQFLPFSIDNILRPGFGHSNPLLDLAATIHQQQLLHHHQQQLKSLAAVAAAAAATTATSAAATSSVGPHSKAATPTTAATTARATTPKSHFKFQPKSPTTTTSTPESNNNNNNQPVDLSSKSSSDGNDSSGSKEDLPPGMVRGPNGQLWPAWVFCTRYSDRPSSGEFFHPGALHSWSLGAT